MKLIENALDILKVYINPEMLKKEKKLRKDIEHKTILDDALKTEFKNKGLSEQELKELANVFNN